MKVLLLDILFCNINVFQAKHTSYKVIESNTYLYQIIILEILTI